MGRIVSTTLAALTVIAAWAALAGAVQAGGGPQDVLVVANRQSLDSLVVADAYRRARGIPERNLCLLDLPLATFSNTDLLPAEKFNQLVVGPLEDFLRRHPSPETLGFIVLAPDLPLRIEFPEPVGVRSFSAMLTQWQTAGVAAPASGGRSVYGLTKKQDTALNPYFRRASAFELLSQDPAPPLPADPLRRLRLVTVLRGYERSDALRLISQSLKSDGTAPAGTFYFRTSGHTKKFPETVKFITDQGRQARMVDGQLAKADDVMGYFSGGSYSGLKRDDIFSNTYQPGAVVDMLESYGAIWANWHGYSYAKQVPVGWFIRAGVTGIHGTTDEPYAAAFPSYGYAETFFANYLGGANLAESFWSAIPVLRWQNMVIGDPLCAPYAVRSQVAWAAPVAAKDGTAIVTRDLTVKRAKSAPPVREVRFYLDGKLHDTRKGPLVAQAEGEFAAQFQADPAKLADGWHELLAVVVDDSPAAVQSWAAAQLETVAHGRKLAIEMLPPAVKPPAAGDTVKFKVTWTGETQPAQIVLRAGLLELGRMATAGGEVSFDSAQLGPGSHQLQSAACDQSGSPLAQSNFVTLELAEPLRVVEFLPDGPTGRWPMILLCYSDKLAATDQEAARAVQLQQGGQAVKVRCTVNGRNLVIEPLAALRPKIAATLRVSWPQNQVRSLDFSHEFPMADNEKLLYELPRNAPPAMTVDGVTLFRNGRLDIVWNQPSLVALGPVDLHTPKRPALGSLLAYRVSARINIDATARPPESPTAGAGLGALYSDIDNYCLVRIERDNIVAYQCLGGKISRLAAWLPPAMPATPGTPPTTAMPATTATPTMTATTGLLAMALEVNGPQVTVLIGGQKVGQFMVDPKLPPGWPLVVLQAAKGVWANEIKVERP